MTNDLDPATSEAESEPRRDTLTIARFLLLTAGIAIGLGVFSPVENDDQPNLIDINLDYVIVFYNAILIGISLPAPLFIISQRLRKGPPVGPGGLLAVTMGLGSLLMLPPIFVDRLQQEEGIAFACIHYMLPLVSFWYLLAALVAGKLGRELFARTTAWTERYGFFLALFWTPVGVWWLITFYMESFE
jgi:hypothetical protein